MAIAIRIAAACLLQALALAAPIGAKDLNGAGGVPAWACRMPPGATGRHASINATVLHSKQASLRGGSRHGSGEQQVQMVSPQELDELMSAPQADFVVVFFAPWCQHCRMLVEQDALGNPNNAPLELLNERLQAQNGPSVYKFDADANWAPSNFDVNFVPKLYKVSAARGSDVGEVTAFKGNPQDLASLEQFAMQEADATLLVARNAGNAVGSTSPAAVAAVAAEASPAWACPLEQAPQQPPSAALPGHVALHAKEANAPTQTNFSGVHSVTPVNSSALTSLVLRQDQRILVSFFAPWCPHCRTFVIADTTGNKTNAPLEVLNRRLEKDGGPLVVKYDTTQGPAPAMFRYKYIPTTFLVTKEGVAVTFKGDPHNLDELRAFAMDATAVQADIPITGTVMHLRKWDAGSKVTPQAALPVTAPVASHLHDWEAPSRPQRAQK